MIFYLRNLTIALIFLLANGAYAAEDFCFGCHSVQEGMSLIFKNDIHYGKGLSCADCHGGDPKINDMNLSKTPETGFRRRPTRQTMPEYCGRCHSDAQYMANYDPKMRVDQLALYTKGVHGKQMAADQSKSAQCTDCHSVHDTRAVSDPQSPASPEKITDTCAKCHKATAEAYRDTGHGHKFINNRRPGCVACHANHDTQPATAALLTGKDTGCTHCHKADSEPAKAGTEIAQLLANLEAAGPSAREALARARVAVHTLDVAAVKRAAESVTTRPDTTQK